MKVKEMRALTITQPWAHCLVTKARTEEIRSWNTHRRGYIAIHGSSSYKSDRFLHCVNFYKIYVLEQEVDYGAIIGFAKIVDVKKEKGEYHIKFDDVIRLKDPVETKGMLGFWGVDKKVLNKCLGQLNQSQLSRITKSLDDCN